MYPNHISLIRGNFHRKIQVMIELYLRRMRGSLGLCSCSYYNSLESGNRSGLSHKFCLHPPICRKQYLIPVTEFHGTHYLIALPLLRNINSTDVFPYQVGNLFIYNICEGSIGMCDILFIIYDYNRFTLIIA